jgi:hypothetical protein
LALFALALAVVRDRSAVRARRFRSQLMHHGPKYRRGEENIAVAESLEAK